MDFTPAELREDLLAIEDGGRASRSTLARWMTLHTAEFAALIQDQQPSWKALAGLFNARGMRNGRGQPLTPERVRQTWYAIRISAATSPVRPPSTSPSDGERFHAEDPGAGSDGTSAIAKDDATKIPPPATTISVEVPAPDPLGAMLPTVTRSPYTAGAEQASQLETLSPMVSSLVSGPDTQDRFPELSDQELIHAMVNAPTMEMLKPLQAERGRRLTSARAAGGEVVRQVGRVSPKRDLRP